MKFKRVLSILIVTVLMIGVLPTLSVANAATYGSLYYEIANGEVTITNCNTSAETVSIPSEIEGYPVTTIGDYAFANSNTSLENITIPDSVTTIGEGAFYYCDSLTSITIPDSVTEIGVWAFYGCTKLASITIPDSVTTIGEWAFRGCTKLEKICITDVAAWCTIKFSNSCSNPCCYGKLYLDDILVTSITIPDSVTTIGEYVFSGCTSLESITIPDSVTTIGEGAFYCCDSLPSITIPDSVTTIGEYAFYGCDALPSITIPDSVTTIGKYAFEDCDALTNITISDGVTTIGEYAFSGCYALTNITIPDSVTTIGEYAFSRCTSLESITIPDSVTTIGDYAFYFCDSLTEIYVEENNLRFSLSDGVLYNKTKTELICCTVGKNGSFIIPNGVTIIHSGAFSNCGALSSITIPDSVTTIGDDAFYSCDSLESITIPDGVTTIGESAFEDCDALSSITIPDSVTTIGESAFEDCDALSSITIPDSVTTIGDDAFYDCDALSSITIPDSVTTIGKYAFFGCDALTNITISDGVTTIGEYAFSGCYALTNITIPDSVTTIGEGAFYYCDSLTSITIPDSVTTIGDRAFSQCTSLASITLPNSVAAIDNFAFYSCYSLESITIPDSVTTIDAYAFYNCSKLKTVNYVGTEQDRANIQISSGNSYLLNATWNYHQHVYDNDCDGDCNECSATRTPPHVYDNDCDGDCNECGAIRTPEPHKVGLYTLENDSNYPFSYDSSTGVYSSTNKSDSTTATMTLTAQHSGTLTIEHYTSTESGFDKLIITHNSTNVVTRSGSTSWQTTTLSVVAGDKIYIKYSKDYSASSGYDTVYFKLYGFTLAENIEPTCEDAVICDVCGVTVKATLDHVYSNDCDSTCENCDYTRETIHNWSDYIYNDDATTESDGTKTRTCSVCGESETIVVIGSKLPEGWEDDPTYRPYEHMPFLTLNEAGNGVVLDQNKSWATRVYWGNIGDTQVEYNWFDEDFRLLCGTDYFADYSPKAGETYNFTKPGWYRFVVKGIRTGTTVEDYTYSELVFDFYYDGSVAPTVPTITELGNNQIKINTNGTAIKKFYYGNIGQTNVPYSWFNSFWGTALETKTYTPVFDTRDGRIITLQTTGYYNIVIVLNDGTEYVYTTYVSDAAPVVRKADGESKVIVDIDLLKGNVGTKATMTKLYYGYLGTEDKEISTWADFTANVPKRVAASNVAQGTAYNLSNKGYYKFYAVMALSNGRTIEAVYTVDNN